MAKIQHVTRPAMKALLEPYGLSEAVRCGDTLTLAGQTGMNAEHKIVDGGLKAQATQAFRNIKEVIEFAGGSVDNIVLCCCCECIPHEFFADHPAIADGISPVQYD